MRAFVGGSFNGASPMAISGGLMAVIVTVQDGFEADLHSFGYKILV